MIPLPQNRYRERPQKSEETTLVLAEAERSIKIAAEETLDRFSKELL